MQRAPFSRVIPDLIAERAALAPDAPAVIGREAMLTYAELDARGARVAAGLASLGVRRGDRVGLLCTNRVEWLETLLGAGAIGAVVAAFDTWSRTWDLEYLLASSSATVLVTLDSFRDHRYLDSLLELVPEVDRSAPGEWRSARFPTLREIVVIGDDVPHGARRFADLASGPARGSPRPGADVSAQDVAVVLYTSGSTARPKGVPLVHAAAIENGFNIGERMRLTADDRVWVSVPLFWSYGSVNASMATITHGATLVLQEAFEAGEALDLLEQHRCTVLYTLPNMTASLLAHPAFDRAKVASLRTGLTIGTPEDVRRAAVALGARGICNVYGSTETYGNCCVTPTDAPLDVRMRSQGPPLPGMRIRISDPDTGAELPPGVMGEVWVGGYVATEYVGSPELTAEAFTPDGLYRTGDLGVLDEDGSFRFVSRISDMIKSGGINISPLEVETFLVRHPDVRAAAVVGREDEARGQVAVAFVQLHEGASVSGDAIREHCRAAMASYKVPSRVVVVDELPKTDTGKLNRRVLRELELPAAPSDRDADDGDRSRRHDETDVHACRNEQQGRMR